MNWGNICLLCSERDHNSLQAPIHVFEAPLKYSVTACENIQGNQFFTVILASDRRQTWVEVGNLR